MDFAAFFRRRAGRVGRVAVLKRWGGAALVFVNLIWQIADLLRGILPA